MPRCSIVIPVYNNASLTRQCLDHILANPPACSFEIIVVDDASTDSTPRTLARYGDSVRVVTHSKNQGFATGCNDGAAAGCGDYIVFLNNDTIPHAGWLDALVAYISARPQCGLVGSKLLFPNGTIQHAGIAICQDHQPRHIYVGFPAHHPVVNKARRMQAVTGACVMLSRELFAKTKGFDTTFVNGFEDIDLCHRLAEMGYEIHYCPDSVLIHFESVSEGRAKFETLNGEIYHKRWANKIQPDDLTYYIADGMIQIQYYANYLEFTLSSELGVVKDGAAFGSLESLLTGRAQQVHSLLRENVLLRNVVTKSSTALPNGIN
jgi:GT2 family glycosyltransferase